MEASRVKSRRQQPYDLLRALAADGPFDPMRTEIQRWFGPVGVRVQGKRLVASNQTLPLDSDPNSTSVSLRRVRYIFGMPSALGSPRRAGALTHYQR